MLRDRFSICVANSSWFALDRIQPSADRNRFQLTLRQLLLSHSYTKTTRSVVNKEKLRVRLPLCIHIVPQYNSHSGVTPIRIRECVDNTEFRVNTARNRRSKDLYFGYTSHWKLENKRNRESKNSYKRIRYKPMRLYFFFLFFRMPVVQKLSRECRTNIHTGWRFSFGFRCGITSGLWEPTA